MRSIQSAPATGWRRTIREHERLAVLGGLAAILLGGLVFRIVYWYGLMLVDPYAYADSAASIARGKPVFDPELLGNLYYTQYIRLSLTVPAAGMYRLFGPGEVQSTLAPIAASLGIAVIAFELARRAGGNRAGLIAAFLACIFPINVINSTQFLPDIMMAFFAGLTMLLFLSGLEAGSRRDRLLLFFATGVAWALAFYGKQTSIALAIPFAVLVVWRRKFLPELFAGVPGALVVLGLVQVLLMSLGGDFLDDIRTTVREGRDVDPAALGYTDIDFSYINDLLRDPMFIPTTILFGAGMFAIVAARGWRGLTKGYTAALVTLVVGQYLYFEFLMRLPSLYSWWKEPRYILSLLIPMFSLAGVGLSAWIEMMRGRFRIAAGAYVMGGLLFAAAVSLYTVRNDHAYWSVNRIDALAQDLAEAIDDQPGEAPVFTWNDDLARYTSFHLGLDRTTFYERYRNEGLVRNRFDATGGSLVEPGSLVVIEAAQDEPGLPTAAGPGWTVVWEKPGVVKLYRAPGP